MSMKRIIISSIIFCLTLAAKADTVHNKYEELSLGSIKADGWLQETLLRQRNGISADLDRIYPQVCGERNGWLGGDGDQWERGPYWIDGLLPLAYILDDKALQAKVQRWVEWALASQREDGFFGPAKDYAPEPGIQRTKACDWWPRMVMLKVMQQYYNATADERVLTFLDKYFRYQYNTLPSTPINKWTPWAAYRLADNMIVALWLYRKTHQEYLLELCDMLHNGGFDFTGGFLSGDILSRPGTIHCVNLAQGLKEPIIYWQRSGEKRYLDAMDKFWDDYRVKSGYPNGMFGGDEAYRGNNPVQGIELCSIVEMMYSMEEMLKATGNVRYAEHLERIAFNALPAHVTDDFREHQYFQQTNQVSISRGPHNFDINYNGTQNLFGLLTGYPCCLCNQHQGWPKFTQNLWYSTADGGFAATYYAPCHFTARIGKAKVSVYEKTEYPFDGRINVSIRISGKKKSADFPVSFRIPLWAEGATVTVNGVKEKGVVSGTMLTIARTWSDGDAVELTFPMKVKVGRWFENAAAVERGPLVYVLKIDGKWTKVALDPDEGKGPSYWSVEAASPWNYGLLKKSVDSPETEFQVAADSSKLTGGWYWNEDAAPVTISVQAVRVPGWTMYNGDTGTIPYSQIPSAKFNVSNRTSSYVSDGNYDTVTLIPYGCSTLRITEFPIISK